MLYSPGPMLASTERPSRRALNLVRTYAIAQPKPKPPLRGSDCKRRDIAKTPDLAILFSFSIGNRLLVPPRGIALSFPNLKRAPMTGLLSYRRL